MSFLIGPQKRKPRTVTIASDSISANADVNCAIICDSEYMSQNACLAPKMMTHSLEIHTG